MMCSAGLLGATLLGVLQGLTEFLPVSSSGHLVLFQQFIELEGDEVAFDLLLHLGTLIPAIWFYRADVLQVLNDTFRGDGRFWDRPGVRLALLVLIATVPTGLIGVLFKDTFEAMFHALGSVSIAFAVTGLLLHMTAGTEDGEWTVTTTPYWAAACLGVAQGLAITPGISRSGTTIAVAMLLGLKREFAVKLSFLMSVPAILGAVVLKLDDVESLGMAPSAALAGTLAALVTGYLALVLLVRLVKIGRFADFRWYLWALAAVTGGLATLA